MPACSHTYTRLPEADGHKVWRYRCRDCGALAWKSFGSRWPIRLFADQAKAAVLVAKQIEENRRALSLSSGPLAKKGSGPNGSEPRDPNEA